MMTAVIILSLSILGPMTIASRGLNTALYAKNQITAFYLAQDGIELVKNLRDNNRLNSRSWLYYNVSVTDLSSPVNGCGSPRACRVDARTGQILEFCSSLEVCDSTKIKYNNSQGYYTYVNTDPNTIFSRSVRVDVISAKEVRITAYVKWNVVGSGTRTVTLTDNMINIY